jgi:CheY-like chemotaxis protein
VVKPVIVVVDDEADSLTVLVHELESRYGSHYRIVASGSAEDVFVRLGELRAQARAVPLVLADQWMPERTGVELLARVREIDPTTRRGLLISWGDRSSAAPILQAAMLGQIELYLTKSTSSPVPPGDQPARDVRRRRRPARIGEAGGVRCRRGLNLHPPGPRLPGGHRDRISMTRETKVKNVVLRRS